MAQIIVQSQRPWTRQPPTGVQIGGDDLWRSTVVAVLGNDGRNLVNDDRPTPSGTIPFRPTTVGVGKSMYITALRYAKSPSIGSGDFLATLVVRKNAAYNYAYAISGTSDVSSGIHLFCEHASVSGQWGIVANGAVRGCGATLTVGRDYVLQIMRVGTTVYYLQDGQATPTPSTTISGSVFLDSAWSIGEYKPSSSFGGDICVSGFSVQKGTFSLVQAKALAANPWKIFRPRNQRTFFDLVSAGVTVSPASANLVVTGGLPGVEQHISVLPASGSALLVGHVPTVSVSDHVTVSPAVGHAAIVGYAPEVSQTAHVTVSPDAGHGSYAGHEPNVTVGGNIDVSPGAAHAELSGNSPTIEQNIAVSPSVGNVNISGNSPSVGVNLTISPLSGHATILGNAPTIEQHISASPAVGHATITGYVPSVVITAGGSISPETGHVSTSGYTPAILQPRTISPLSGHALLNGNNPIIVQGVRVSPTTGHVVINGNAPVIEQGGTVTVSPVVGHAVITGYAPLIATIGARTLPLSDSRALSLTSRRSLPL